MSESSQIRFPFSVHTATYGYDWSSVPSGLSRSDLNEFYRLASKAKPDILSPGDFVSGVLAMNGRVAAFEIQIARRWDANGRDAEYAAFAFLPDCETAAQVDFSLLLTQGCFRVPNRVPFSEITYEGPASETAEGESVQTAIRRLCRYETLDAFDFSRIGSVLAANGKSAAIWLFSKIQTAQDERTKAETFPSEPVLAEKAEEKPAGSENRQTIDAPARSGGLDPLTVLAWAGGILVAIVMAILALAR